MKSNNTVLSSILSLSMLAISVTGCGLSKNVKPSAPAAATSLPAPTKAQVTAYVTAPVIDKNAKDASIQGNIVTDKKSGRVSINNISGMGLSADDEIAKKIIAYMPTQPGEGVAILKRGFERALLPIDQGGLAETTQHAAQYALYFAQNFADDENHGSLKGAKVADFDKYFDKALIDGNSLLPAINE